MMTVHEQIAMMRAYEKSQWWQRMKSRNDDSAWEVVMMTVYEQIAMMTSYEKP